MIGFHDLITHAQGERIIELLEKLQQEFVTLNNELFEIEEDGDELSLVERVGLLEARADLAAKNTNYLRKRIDAYGVPLSADRSVPLPPVEKKCTCKRAIDE